MHMLKYYTTESGVTMKRFSISDADYADAGGLNLPLSS
jgi:hypothetical protein